MNNCQVFVTGANSLLGSNVICQLLQKGYHVKGLLRNRKTFKPALHENLQLIEGDFTDPRLVKTHLKGCDYVIHIAAVTKQDLLKYSDYRQINVLATQQLLLLSMMAQVKRFIYTGSANSFGFGSKEFPGNEYRPTRKPFINSYYCRSKLEAEKMCLKFKDRIEVVSVNPTFMLGAYDAKPSSGQILFMGYNKKVIFYPPGGKNFVHAQDVADGVISAMLKGRNGESYILSGDNLSYRDFFKKLSEMTGNKPQYVKVPAKLLMSAGQIGNISRSIGIPNKFTLSNMEMLCINNYYTHKKAQEELEYHPRPVEYAIKDALEWFKGNGML